MNNKSKLFLAFGVGALLGAVVTALFTTGRGKELIGKAKEKMKDLEEEIADLLRENDTQENPGV